MPPDLCSRRPAAPEVLFRKQKMRFTCRLSPRDVVCEGLGGCCVRCGGCRWARYSSRDAQKTAWSQGHRQECAELRACAPRRPPASVRLAARIYWGQQGALPASVEALEHHWGQLSDARKQEFAQMAVLAR